MDNLQSRVAITEAAIRRLQSVSSETFVDSFSEDSTVPARKNPSWYSDLFSATAAQIYPLVGTAIGSASIATVTGQGMNHPGVQRIASSAANGGYRFYFFNAVDAVLFGGTKRAEWIWQHKVASGTNTVVRCGFLDTTTTADAVDGAYFELSGSLAVTAKTSNNSSRTTSATLMTLTVDRWYRFVVTGSNRGDAVLFEIFDDTGKLLASTTITSNIPTATGREFGCGFVCYNTTSAVTLAWLDWGLFELGVGDPIIR